MKAKLDYFKIAPQGFSNLMSLEKYIADSYRQRGTLEHELIELVKIRVSQINKCSYCIDMHTKDARLLGISEQNIYGLSAWEDSPFYDDRTKAALLWAETLTLITNDSVIDENYNFLENYFSKESIVDLTLVITSINTWNRVAKAFSVPAGSYQPGQYDI
jgi:AhpD family alkylhydroperoxidase